MSDNALLEAALRYAGYGWRVIPLHNQTPKGYCTCQSYRDKKAMGPCPNPGKHPRFLEWAKVASKDERRLGEWWQDYPLANVGIVSGAESGILVLDCDPRHNGIEARDALVTKHGQLPYTTTVKTGGADNFGRRGTHEYFQWPADLPTTKTVVELAEGLEVLLDPHIVVAPPSLHPSGRRYEFEEELGPDECLPVAAPDWLVDQIRKQLEDAPQQQEGNRGGWPLANIEQVFSGCAWMCHCTSKASTLSEPEWYAQLSIVGRCRDGEVLALELSAPHPGFNKAATLAKLRHAVQDAGPATCAKIASSLGGSRFCEVCPNRGKVKSPVVLGLASGATEVNLSNTLEVAGKVNLPSRKTAPSEVNPATDSDDGGSRPVPPRAPDVQGRLSSDWKSRLLRNSKGPIPVIANAIIALRGACSGVLGFDEFSSSARVLGAPPWGGGAGPVTDHVDRLAADWLQHNDVLVSPEIAAQAIQVVCKDNSFHPVKDYLLSRKWDGVKRVESWLNLYLGVAPTDYTMAIGQRWLISAVARIMEPGVKADCCLILEGQQGMLKSTAVRRLGEPWTTDEISDVGSKDAALQIRGVWLVELAELDSLARGEAGRIKAFMSRAIDRFRPPYGRHVIESPRQCVFVGSVNHNVYLRDETGGRRFWPATCTRILINDLIRDRDQLWAESVHLYRAGRPWWLDKPDLVMAAEAEQGDRYEGDSWDALIEAWVADQVRQGETSVSTREILEGCIKKPAAQLVRGDSMRVAACLRSLRWERFRLRMPNDELEWRYRPPVPTTSGNSALGGNSAAT